MNRRFCVFTLLAVAAVGVRGTADEKVDKVIAELDRRIEVNPDNAGLYDRRGSEYFIRGKIKESIQDFDRAIKIDPRRERGHWKRGISYYYAAEYDKGRKQFEAYQTFDDNDVPAHVRNDALNKRGESLAAAEEAEGGHSI